ncbi:MAG: hypothetical protein ACI4S2_03590 [Lachnospiraceae bacterium]
MDIITGLQNKKDTEAHQLLLQLEKRSAESNTLYEYFEDFIKLLNNKSFFVRTRGFRLACAQAQWDVENKIDKNLAIMLLMLDDEKPTAVRQCLTALHTVIFYKPELCKKIVAKLDMMDLSKYKDSMSPLIKKDMEELRKMVD